MRSIILTVAMLGSAAAFPAFAQEPSTQETQQNMQQNTQQNAQTQENQQPQQNAQNTQSSQQQQNITVSNAQIHIQKGGKNAQAWASFKNNGSQDLYIKEISYNEKNQKVSDNVSFEKNSNYKSHNKQAKNENESQPKIAAGKTYDFSNKSEYVISLKDIKQPLQNNQDIAFNITYSDGSQQTVNFKYQQDGNKLTN